MELLDEPVISRVRPQPSIEEQKQYAEAAANALETLATRLSLGGKFVEEFAAEPHATLGAAGIVLHKEGIEFLMAFDPDRFDRITDKLFDVLDPAMLSAMSEPSCS